MTQIKNSLRVLNCAIPLSAYAGCCKPPNIFVCYLQKWRRIRDVIPPRVKFHRAARVRIRAVAYPCCLRIVGQMQALVGLGPCLLASDPYSLHYVCVRLIFYVKGLMGCRIRCQSFDMSITSKEALFRSSFCCFQLSVVCCQLPSFAFV